MTSDRFLHGALASSFCFACYGKDVELALAGEKLGSAELSTTSGSFLLKIYMLTWIPRVE